MTSIVLDIFGGMVPRDGDEILPPSAASDAANCLLLSGELRPLHLPSLLNRFYPGNTHQENADEAYLGPLDPYVEYDEVVNALPFEPIVWVKGYNGIINEGTGGAYAYSDLHDLPEPELVNGYLDWFDNTLHVAVRPRPFQTWFITLLDPPAVQGYFEDSVFAAYSEAFNTRLFNTQAYVSGFEQELPFGFPISWAIRANNIYNVSTDPANPTVAPARGSFRVINGLNSGNPVIFAESPVLTTDSNGPAVSIPERTGVNVITNYGVTLQLEVETFFDWENGVESPPDASCTSYFSAYQYRPKMGRLGPSYAQNSVQGSLSIIFRYEDTTSLGAITSDQYLIAFGECLLFITAGSTLTFRYENSPYRAHTVANLEKGREYVFLFTQEIISTNPPEAAHRVYLNGEKVIENMTAGYWQPGGPVVTDILCGTTSMGTNFNFRRPILSNWAQLLYWGEVLTDQQALDLYNGAEATSLYRSGT